MGADTEHFFLQQWCEQTTHSITRIQADVTSIKLAQSAQGGRIKALERTEKSAKWAIRGATAALVAVVVDYVKNHLGR